MQTIYYKIGSLIRKSYKKKMINSSFNKRTPHGVEIDTNNWIKDLDIKLAVKNQHLPTRKQ